MSEYQFNEAQLKWLDALESGEYQQTTGMLLNEDGSCCLGIGCFVVGMSPSEIHEFQLDKGYTAPASVRHALNLRDEIGGTSGVHIKGRTSLAGANDSGATFSEIAAFIRSNPTAVFKE